MGWYGGGGGSGRRGILIHSKGRGELRGNEICHNKIDGPWNFVFRFRLRSCVGFPSMIFRSQGLAAKGYWGGGIAGWAEWGDLAHGGS